MLPARLDSEGRIVTLDQQNRGRYTREIAEGVRILQSHRQHTLQHGRVATIASVGQVQIT